MTTIMDMDVHQTTADNSISVEYYDDEDIPASTQDQDDINNEPSESEDNSISPANTQTANTETKPEAKSKNELITQIINKNFELTQVKLSEDDPVVALMLMQKIEIEAQLKNLKESIKTDITKATIKESNERLIEVDKRFKLASELAEKLEFNRQMILTELGNLHQKNIIVYANEHNKKLEGLKTSLASAITLSKFSMAITALTMFIVLVSNLN